MTKKSLKCWLLPWLDRREVARREALAAAAERAMVQDRRPVVARIVFELGIHQRDNHFVDMIQSVARGKNSIELRGSN